MPLGTRMARDQDGPHLKKSPVHMPIVWHRAWPCCPNGDCP
jgi:hypothetical protein